MKGLGLGLSVLLLNQKIRSKISESEAMHQKIRSYLFNLSEFIFKKNQSKNTKVINSTETIDPGLIKNI